VGDHVLLTSRDLPARGGCYAEYIAVPASAVHRLPAHVDFIAAAALSNYQVANALLSDAVGGHARTLFISGIAGGVGSALTDLAKCMGHTVIGTASSAEKIAFAKSVGADHVINYRTDNVVKAVLQLTAGKGVDVVLDHVGGVNFFDNLQLLAPFGMLVSFNAFGPQPQGNLLNELRTDANYSKAVRCFSFHSYDALPLRRRELMREVIQLLGEGRIKPRVAASLPMAQAAAVHRMIEAGQGLGKFVLVP
jgi:NADPH:quinone reductase